MPAPKSNKQRLTELKAKRAARKAKSAKRAREDAARFRAMLPPPEGSAPVNADLFPPLGTYGFYDVPAFVKRGTYLPKSFVCKECGKDEVWTATQQKWWYEVAKGGPMTTASRCRPCRRRERERAADQNKRTEVGLKRKAALMLAGKWRTGL